MARSEITIDLGALRRNAAAAARRLLDGAELWAVVKADGYGHGAVDCAGAALDAGATALCVATVGEALALRRPLPDARHPRARPGGAPTRSPRHGTPASSSSSRASEIPDDVAVHVKLDTGMGRWGVSELPAPVPRRSSA